VAKRNAGELIAGAIVLAAAAGFLGYAVANTGRTTVSGYTLHAAFDNISGISVGSPVRLAGVQVGSVTGARVDPQSYRAVLSFTVQPSVKLPTDSSAEITTEGILGGNSLSLTPGGEEKMLADGAQITITQSPVSIEQLLGKFIYNVGELSSNVQKQLDANQKKQDAPK
jgi:phospholipid/cholesterol/gamma-HCH transport system substrate-binding protein